MTILILNGPNLSRLGKREPHIYGTKTLAELEKGIVKAFEDITFEFFQSESEGELIQKLHQANDSGKINGVVFNAGAYTHYSIALRDAISSLSIPVVEVHLSNIHARESFRKQSVISDVCLGVVSGFGEISYHLGVAALKHQLK